MMVGGVVRLRGLGISVDCFPKYALVQRIFGSVSSVVNALS